jgi:hypothetical protein
MRTATIVAVFVPLAVAVAERQTQFRISTSLVRLDVAVTDESGAIRGLTLKDFVVEDHGVSPSIRVEESADAPLDLVLVAPPLASVDFVAADQTARVAAGVEEFLQQVQGRDRLAAVVAGAPPRRLRQLELGRPSFNGGAFTGGSYAAPFDAIVVALGEFVESDRRRALIAFTNAADFRSTVSFEGLVGIAGRLGPAFVLVGTPVRVQDEVRTRVTRNGRQFGDVVAGELSGYVFPATLQRLAQRTGGITVNLGRGHPAQVMAEMFSWLRWRYVISYEPPAGKGWHPVTVKVNRRGARVSTREGYFVD